MYKKYEGPSLRDKVFVSAASAVGAVARVEKWPDVYRDYCLTACELVQPAHIHPKQLALLKKDPAFKDETSFFVVTALSEGKKGALKQRDFFVPEKLLEKMGIDAQKVREDGLLGDGTMLISDTKISLTTLGQYLGENAPIIPRGQSVESTQISEPERKSFDERIRKSTISKSFESKFQS